MNIPIIRTQKPKQKPETEKNLGFCRTFSDYMFIMEYNDKDGWHSPRVQPYGPLNIDPASPVLHYAQEIFEGLKAYRRTDGSIGLFRPRENAKRLNRSAERMCIPLIDEEIQLEAMRTIVEVEKDWVPHSEGTSLYLRPTVIAEGNTLGVHAADRYIYFIICSPSGAYYEHGLKPVRIHIEPNYVRSVKGGTGGAKTGGNYACSLRAAEDAKKHGFDQVLWLDGKRNRYIEEVGAMNVMFMIDGKLITPQLSGSILAGITRDSVLQLARDKGIPVEERAISVYELIDAYKVGKLTEAFGTGTAAVISPIGELVFKDNVLNLGDSIGEVSQYMYDTLTGIQFGRLPDEHGWTEKVCMG
ncbi:MAG: branched-chain amino acid aminotransferase [Clostridia bacterium]|nr:branched-chain amino acid aminotransferase [Clostridia bacterium]